MIGHHSGRRRWPITVVAVVIMAVLIFPLYYTLEVSFQPSSTILASSPGLIPLHPVLSNYRLAAGTMWPNIEDSLIVSGGVVGLTLLIAVPAAYGLARFWSRFVGLIVTVLLVSQMVPAISLTIAFFSLFHRLHLLNSAPGLILADSTYSVPFSILVLRAFFSSLPGPVIEAAEVDGCGQLRTLVSIVVPMAVPGVITAALFSFLFAWGDLLFAFTLNIGGFEPVTLGLYKFSTAFTTDWGGIMASVVLAAIPSGLFLAAAQRWVTGGLRAGALAG